MEREVQKQLAVWKTKRYRKPLLIRGAKHTGKTSLIQSFGRDNFQQTVYINLGHNERMKSVLKTSMRENHSPTCYLSNTPDKTSWAAGISMDIKRLLFAIQVEAGLSLSPKNTLIILDEIQEVPEALFALQCFYQKAPAYAVTAISDGFMLEQGAEYTHLFSDGTHSGSIEILDVFPLSFPEFLSVTGELRLKELLDLGDFELANSFSELFLEKLSQYFVVGGMPKAVQTYLDSGDFRKVREIQREILSETDRDMGKEGITETLKKQQIFHTLSSQLSKDNKKFFYGRLKKGARAKEYEPAIRQLEDAGIVYKVCRMAFLPEQQGKYHIEENCFKLFMLDIGLLGAAAEYDFYAFPDRDNIFESLNGGMAEQYVFQQFMGNHDWHLNYWANEKSTGGISFLMTGRKCVIPLEVMTKENLQAKNLKNYCFRYHPQVVVRTCLSDYRREDWMVNIPLYAAAKLGELRV